MIVAGTTEDKMVSTVILEERTPVLQFPSSVFFFNIAVQYHWRLSSFSACSNCFVLTERLCSTIEESAIRTKELLVKSLQMLPMLQDFPFIARTSTETNFFLSKRASSSAMVYRSFSAGTATVGLNSSTPSNFTRTIPEGELTTNLRNSSELSSKTT